MTVRYSESGSNEREKEEQTYIFFVDYLEECEGGMAMYMNNDVGTTRS